jgi:Spy/CpxP family protein refolding chaperone
MQSLIHFQAVYQARCAIVPSMAILRNLIVPAAFAAAIMVPAASFAQETGAPGPAGTQSQGQWQGRSHHGGMMHMLRDLNLSDQQKTQIQQIMQQYRQSHTQGERPDPQAREQLRNQIMNVLTPQQRTQLQAKMQSMRGQGERAEPQSTPQP